jgi:hypothetical protein
MKPCLRKQPVCALPAAALLPCYCSAASSPAACLARTASPRQTYREQRWLNLHAAAVQACWSPARRVSAKSAFKQACSRSSSQGRFTATQQRRSPAVKISMQQLVQEAYGRKV